MERIDVEEKGGAVVVRVAGELGLANIKAFENVFKKYLNSKIAVIALDLREMPFLDSFGISRLVKISRAFAGHADFVLINMNDVIYQTFRMSTFDKFFTIMTEDEFNRKYYSRDMYAGDN